MDEIAKRRQELALRQSAIAGAPPAVYRAFLEHGPRSRLYRIDPLGADTWRCEVWFGATVHRTTVVGKLGMDQLRAQYAREVEQLIEDGWQLQT